MDYEKAYIEALERAKAGKPLDEVFPELKESEDERIRKWLIDMVSYGTWRKGWPFGPDEVVAYLEKQKEQKPNPYTGTGFYYNGHHWGMCARDGGVEIIVDGKIRDRVSFESENSESSNSVAKEMFIKALERAVEQTKKGYELTDCDKHSWWEDFKAYSGIKPAEWSEEDEKVLNSVLSSTKTVLTENNRNWLKSLPERFSLQPKQEWSEREQHMLNCIEYSMRAAMCIPDNIIKWTLEHLRPRPHWKPSEEQMRAVFDASERNDKLGSVLRNLYNDLKKLI